MRNVIRLGDQTTHGGKVVSVAATHFKVDGIPVACVDDPCICPVTGHVDCKVATGSPVHKINGKSIAFEGDKTSCGATLIASGGTFKAP